MALVEIAAGEGGKGGKAAVLPPVTVPPFAPIRIKFGPAGEFWLDRKDGAVEFNGVVAAPGASCHPPLKHVATRDRLTPALVVAAYENPTAVPELAPPRCSLVGCGSGVG